MTESIPVDTRAAATLLHLLYPLNTALSGATDKKSVESALITYLPFGMATAIELKMAVRNRNQRMSIPELKQFVYGEAQRLLKRSITPGNRFHTYMREDIVRWYNSNPTHQNYFRNPGVETILITVTTPDRVRKQVLTLSEDQLVGIAYGLHSLAHLQTPHITTMSSVTNAPIEFNQIVENALSYRMVDELATERLTRPYRVEIIAGGAASPVYFVQPEFMQGLLSVASWYDLPNRGEGTLWQNLTQFTRDGEIRLRL